MTRRALPKPVEAWAIADEDGLAYADTFRTRKRARSWCPEDCYIIRVRIVPVQPKPRTKRKERK